MKRMFLLSLFWVWPARAHDGEGPRATAKDTAPEKAAEGAPAADKHPFQITPFGFLRAGYERVDRDAAHAFIGEHSGFLVDAARVGLEGESLREKVRFRTSVEAASTLYSESGENPSLQVRLRDAFARYDPAPFFGVALGQFRAPFSAETMRPSQTLLFASRSIGEEGIRPGRGFVETGLSLERQIGLMVAPDEPFAIGPVRAAYYGMLMNPGGENRLSNASGAIGLLGRVEVGWEKYVMLGGAAYSMPRTVGTRPDLFDENDQGLNADARFTAFNVELYGQFTRVRTAYPTAGTEDRVRLGYHAQVGYLVKTFVPFSVAYRYAHLDPWSRGGGAGATQNYRNFRVDAHTIGVRVFHPRLPASVWANYTLMVEPSARQVDNNRLELTGLIVF